MYKLEIDITAKRELQKLDKHIQKFILDNLLDFISNFNLEFETQLINQGKIKHLQGNYQGLYRLRLRNYRIIYAKKNDVLMILVLRIAHRKEVY
jgi:mRNA interferase RelE/StbE